MDRSEIPLQNQLDGNDTNFPPRAEHSLNSINSELPREADIKPQERPLEQESSTEIEYSAWESQVAKLVGLEDESYNREQPDATHSAREQLISESEIETSSQQTLASNPFAKLGLVSFATLAIALLVGIFLSQITNIGQTKPSQEDMVASEPQKPSDTESYMLDLEAEVENLKTKLALAKQVEAVKTAQQSLREEAPKLEATVKENLNPPSNPQPPQPATATAPVNEPRVVYVQPPVQQPAPPPPEAKPQPEPDPFQEWAKLAKLGSYGQVSGDSEVRNTQQPRNQNTNSEPRINQPLPNRTIEPESQIARQSPTPLEENLATRLPRRNQERKLVAVGNTASAVLATAVFGETTSSSNPNQQDETVFVVNLQEPLKASNGEVALPVDTQLLVKIGSLSERGLVKLKIDKVMIPEDNNHLAEKSFPPNAFAIHTPGGKPLLAKKFPNQSGSIALKDAQMFMLGGLGKAAELYNRVDTEITINDGSNTTVSSGDSQRNISAGAVQGGIEALVPVLAQRNQQQISQMMQRTDVWLVPAGEEVELYVNREIIL